MSYRFDPQEGLVVVQAELSGPSGNAVLRLALDTGATNTIVNFSMLVAIGYDPGAFPERMELTTGSGIEFAPMVVLEKIVAIGKERMTFPVLAHTLPPSAGVDGLLGLDFLRGEVLTVDFRIGEIIVT